MEVRLVDRPFVAKCRSISAKDPTGIIPELTIPGTYVIDTGRSSSPASSTFQGCNSILAAPAKNRNLNLEMGFIGVYELVRGFQSESGGFGGC